MAELFSFSHSRSMQGNFRFFTFDYMKTCLLFKEIVQKVVTCHLGVIFKKKSCLKETLKLLKILCEFENGSSRKNCGDIFGKTGKPFLWFWFPMLSQDIFGTTLLINCFYFAVLWLWTYHDWVIWLKRWEPNRSTNLVLQALSFKCKRTIWIAKFHTYCDERRDGRK